MCFQDVSPVSPCQSKPADSLISYGCCYNVFWLRSWPIKHPGKWQSDNVFHCKLHNYLITISKQDTVWLCYSRGRRLFSWGKFTEVSVQRADCHRDFFQDKHLVRWSHLPLTAAVLWAEMWQLVEWSTCVVIRLSDWHALNTHSQLIHLHWFGAPSDTTSHAWSVLEQYLTPCRLQEIHTEAENWRMIGSVNGACDSVFFDSPLPRTSVKKKYSLVANIWLHVKLICIVSNFCHSLEPWVGCLNVILKPWS